MCAVNILTLSITLVYGTLKINKFKSMNKLSLRPWKNNVQGTGICSLGLYSVCWYLIGLHNHSFSGCMGKRVETEPLYPKRVDLDKMISQWKRGLISITIVGTAWIYFS